MQHQLKVPDMSCGHCVATIEKAVKGIDPGAEVSADLEKREVTFSSSAEAAAISAAIREAGYDNQPVGS